MAANSTTYFSGIVGITGFLATTGGTISVSYEDGGNGAAIVTVSAVQTVPIVAGGYTPIPLEFAQNGGTITLAGGASGTLFI
tara:strand:+ start:84 stop:329 length:246 start_codon:yes stop_codon:yes gene_type:complete